MATPQEIRAKLESLTPEEFRRFRDCFGGDGNDANYYVSQLFACPQYEAKMCYCLGLPTEADRINRAICDSSKAAIDSAMASQQSADAAVESLKYSRRSARATICAALIALAALIISIVGVLVSAYK